VVEIPNKFIIGVIGGILGIAKCIGNTQFLYKAVYVRLSTLKIILTLPTGKTQTCSRDKTGI